MPEPTAVIDSPTIVNTPAPAPAPTPESKLFASTPTTNTPAPETPVAPVVPDANAPATPQVVPTETKTPTEPATPVVPVTPAPAPAEYDLKLPEGSPLSAEDLATTVKEAKEAGLTKEEAEAKLAGDDKLARSVALRQQQVLKAQNDKVVAEAKASWKSMVEKDPELGGDKLAETTILASRAFKAISGPGDQKFMDESGLGNHPSFVRMMVKVGRMMAEDKFINGTGGNAPPQRSREEKLFGKTTPGADGKLSPQQA